MTSLDPLEGFVGALKTEVAIARSATSIKKLAATNYTWEDLKRFDLWWGTK